jgi:hypothetical protein
MGAIKQVRERAASLFHALGCAWRSSSFRQVCMRPQVMTECEPTHERMQSDVFHEEFRPADRSGLMLLHFLLALILFAFSR